MVYKRWWYIVLVLVFSGLAACQPAAAPETATVAVTSAAATSAAVVSPATPVASPTAALPITGGTEAVSTEAMSTEAMSTEAMSTEAMSTEAMSTEAMSTEAVSTEAMSTEAMSTEAPMASPMMTMAPMTTPMAPMATAAMTGTVGVEALPEIQVEALDFAFRMPTPLQAGWVRVSMTNSGKEPHHLQFLRLNTDVTVAQFQAALQQGEGPALALVQAEGGVGAIDPGGSAQVVVNLPAGNYIVICFVGSPDGVPHFAKGMMHSITVEPASGTPAAALEPSADMSVTLRDFAIEIPASLPAGPLTVQVINAGPEWHELNLLKLSPGATMADVQAFFSNPGGAGGPPPFSAVGGINGLGLNGTGYMLLDLEPGNYLAICNIPSAANQGKPHSALGMMREFTVAP